VRYNLMFPMRAVKHWQRWCQGAAIGDIARVVEDAGFDAFSMSEHPYPDKSGSPTAATTPSTRLCR
jgi:alkanesulfonate monooxygenase SsuD/methylene tetrahydromethanopterin reductase-like flavin-dependent oxidoreductase (luciferase family)